METEEDRGTTGGRTFSALPTPVVLVVIALMAVGAGWFARGWLDSGSAEPMVVEGWAYQAGTSGGIGCCGAEESGAGGRGYSVSGVAWRDLRAPGAPWHGPREGTPECLPASEPVQIRMGVVKVKASNEAPGWELVAWLECL